jgi:sugar lactone lactonase YvrE
MRPGLRNVCLILIIVNSLALDRFGNLYVADTDNNRVLEYDTFLVRVFAPLITH